MDPLEHEPEHDPKRELVVPPPHAEHRPRVVEVTVVSGGSAETQAIEVRLADGRLGVIEPREIGPGLSATPGTVVEVAVLSRNDAAGRVLVSHRWAHREGAWDRICEALAAAQPVTGDVRREIKGGLELDVDGLRAFLPSSHIERDGSSTAGGTDASPLVGRTIEVLVVEADRDRDRIVISQRDLLRRQRRADQRAAWAGLAAGQRLEGTVRAFTELGLQVEVDSGVRGLVHRSEISWNRATDPARAAAVGDRVSVVVLNVDRPRRRLGLSMRAMSPDPLDAVAVGDVDTAVITSVVEYGAFARLLGSNAEGLIHQSELSEQPGVRPDQLVMPGEQVAVKVLEVDRSKRRLRLSVRQALWQG